MPTERNLGFVTLRNETVEERELFVDKARADYDTLQLVVLDCPSHIKHFFEEQGANLDVMQERAFKKWISLQVGLDQGHLGWDLSIKGKRIAGQYYESSILHDI